MCAHPKRLRLARLVFQTEAEFPPAGHKAGDWPIEAIDLPLLTKNPGLKGAKSPLTVQIKAPSPLQALLHAGVFKAAI